MVRALEVSRPVQAFVALEIAADATPFVTRETFDPFVVHRAALRVIAVDSGLVPFVVSGGEKANPPVMLLQVTPPVATVAGIELGLEPDPDPHAAASMATRPKETRLGNLSRARHGHGSFSPGRLTWHPTVALGVPTVANCRRF